MEVSSTNREVNDSTQTRGAEMRKTLPRTFNRTQEYGGNLGGPLIPFGSCKKKAFFFINFERSYSPINTARTVTVAYSLLNKASTHISCPAQMRSELKMF